MAYKANARELQINGVRLSNIGDAMLFALRNQDLTLAFKTHKLFELNSVRLAYHLYGSDTVKDKIRKWQTAVLNNKVEDALKIANEIRGVKGLKFVDPLYINQAPQNFKNTDILKSETFTHADFLYWKEIIAIRAELSQHDSFKEFCEKQLEKISVSNDNAFKSPLECLSESQLNNTSFVGFFAQAATILGRPHLILKTSKDNYQILIQNGLSSLLLSSNSKEIKELNHQSISDSLRVKTQECSIFCSPQSFFSANTYLISLYNCEFRSQSISPCTPSLSWVMAKIRFAGKL